MQIARYQEFLLMVSHIFIFHLFIETQVLGLKPPHLASLALIVIVSWFWGFECGHLKSESPLMVEEERPAADCAADGADEPNVLPRFL